MHCLRLATLIVFFLVLVSSFEDVDWMHEQYEREQLRIRKNTCQMRAEYGHCKGHRSLWYFNDRYGKCMKFNYSNCGGNRNRFYTKEECEEFCEQFDWTLDTLKPNNRYLKRIKSQPAPKMKHHVIDE